jgi:hypothetical protein
MDGAVRSPDPAFEAIKRHQKAVRAVRATSAEIDRLVDLADAAVGPRSIEVPNMLRPGEAPVVVNCWLDIEKYVSPEENAELHAQLLVKLKTQHAARAKYLQEIAGNTDKIMDQPAAEECEAEDALTETVPTSLPGLLAVLTYVSRTSKVAGCTASFDESNMRPLLRSLAKAAKSLGPQARADNPPTVKASTDPMFGLIVARSKDEAWVFVDYDDLAASMVEGFAASMENISA